jgi:hypothetical protein
VASGSDGGVADPASASPRGSKACHRCSTVRRGADPAGHTSVSFTLDRYGHLYPEADTALRDRLDALYVAGAQAEPGVVIELRRDASRPSAAPEQGERRR